MGYLLCYWLNLLFIDHYHSADSDDSQNSVQQLLTLFFRADHYFLVFCSYSCVISTSSFLFP